MDIILRLNFNGKGDNTILEMFDQKNQKVLKEYSMYWNPYKN